MQNQKAFTDNELKKYGIDQDFTEQVHASLATYLDERRRLTIELNQMKEVMGNTEDFLKNYMIDKGITSMIVLKTRILELVKHFKNFYLRIL